MLTLLGAAGASWADGVITHLSGQVTLRKADGKVEVGAAGVKVLPGDILETGPAGYVRVEMTDGGEMVLRPDSQLKLESYAFVPAKPENDSLVFRIVKGGLRTVTGLIGKRGNPNAYEAKALTMTAGIRGTQYDARVCQGNCGALPDGAYLSVKFGAVQVQNPQGTVNVLAGQAVRVPQNAPPALLPRDPGIGFTPPASIPKPDEKKKQAEAAKAAEAKPAAAAKPEAAKPAEAKEAAKESPKDSGKDSSKASDGKTSDGKQEAAARPAASASAGGNAGSSESGNSGAAASSSSSSAASSSGTGTASSSGASSASSGGTASATERPSPVAASAPAAPQTSSAAPANPVTAPPVAAPLPALSIAAPDLSVPLLPSAPGLTCTVE